MKKDLILIGSHCPDEDRESLLNRCVNSLQNCRDHYDILIASHTYIPEYIAKNVDYVFFDKNNELIYDIEYLNQPWFSPIEGVTIFSTFIGDSSTYLAVYRLLMFGLSFAKNFQYKKVHYIEYDTQISDLSELYENSKLLEKYDYILYQKKERDYELNLAWPIGNFMSFKIETMNEIFTRYDKNELLQLLIESSAKTNEKITNDIMMIGDKNLYIKDLDLIDSEKIQFGLSKLTKRESMNYWAVPYYNQYDDRLDVVVWNNKSLNPINVSFVINDEFLISIKNINQYEWQIKEVGNILDVQKITIIVNDEVKTTLHLDDNNRDLFKQTNYSQHL